MMVNSTGIKSTLVIKYVTGQDEKGRDILKTQRIQKIKPSALDESIFEVAVVLGSLLENEKVKVVRENENLIAEA